MSAEEAIVECSSCGAQAARGDMFGVEPELLCEACAEGVRKRMHVRFRPLAKEHLPRATAFCIALMAVVFICTDVIWPRGGQGPRPGWLVALYQSESIWAWAIWKHATALFPHGGWWHVGMNGAFLWWLGRPLEQRIGTPLFVGLLLATGMPSMAAEWMAHAAGAAGMSGAGFGLAGFLMARRKFDATAAALMSDRTIRWILGWGLLCVVLTVVGNVPIGNWAHGVGLAMGFGIGWATGQPKPRVMVSAALLLCLVIVVASVFVAFGNVQMKSGETWSRQEWRRYWLEHHR